ncbi:MAG: fasciclin domain-containing protein [Polyangiaceae bacterium]|nr:fasciclin domain-containing protein [Polyangiaceae bacterium]
MKKSFVLVALVIVMGGCEKSPEPSTTHAETKTTAAPTPAAEPTPEPTRAIDPNAPKDVVGVAVASPDHTTLVKALQAADYVDSLHNAGPFTVFAPNNAAFAKLPKETLDALMKPEKKADLQDILKYHVTTTMYGLKSFTDGQQLAMANGKKVTFHVKDGKVTVNDANIIGTVQATNGIIHVIDTVLIPK